MHQNFSRRFEIKDNLFKQFLNCTGTRAGKNSIQVAIILLLGVCNTSMGILGLLGLYYWNENRG